MADSEKGEKSEEPTPQRRIDFRKRGQVAQSKEIGSFLAIFVSVLGIWMLSRFYLETVIGLFNQSIGTHILEATREGHFKIALDAALKTSFLLVAPVMGLLFLTAFASSALQIGFIYNEDALQFKPERMDPVKGLQKIVSIRSLVEGLKAIVKLLVVGFIVYLVLKAEFVSVPRLMNTGVSGQFSYLGEITLKLLTAVAFFMAVIAGLDFMFQKWEMEKEMKMTKQEVKEEFKSREGDPLIKSKIKRIQREMANRRMMEDVPKADVIITNPTHIAVAIKYDENMVAPQLLAKGAEHVAAKIREIAKENKIPIVENKPLARAIFKTMEIGQGIPRELYTAVAQVLSYVYKLKKKVRA